MDKIYIECEGRTADGKLIECFPDVIKSIFIDEIGLLPGYQVNISLDNSSFEEAGNPIDGLRKDWKCAASICEKQSMDLISELSRESACVVMPNYLSNEKIIVLDSKSTSNMISPDDILINSKSIPEITISKTKIENIYNSFVIRYCLNYANNEYMQMDFINKDDTSLSSSENVRNLSSGTYTGLCLNSYQRYNKKSEYVLEAKYIRDRLTAVKLLKWYADWLTRRRYIVNISCMLNSNTIRFEVGDQVRFSFDLLPNNIGSINIFIITEMDVNYFLGRLDLKLFEISYPL
jgi:hypothetical protein